MTFKKFKVINVSCDVGLKEELIHSHHDILTVGHPGWYKTNELVTRNYWWPGLQHDVNRYVTGCEACQRTKACRSLVKAPLQPHSVPGGPWEVISVDLIGELPESSGYNAICVAVETNSPSRYTSFQPRHP